MAVMAIALVHLVPVRVEDRRQVDGEVPRGRAGDRADTGRSTCAARCDWSAAYPGLLA
jgi:hypothetical protein